MPNSGRPIGPAVSGSFPAPRLLSRFVSSDDDLFVLHFWPEVQILRPAAYLAVVR